MAESAESLLRSGAISAKQANKHSLLKAHRGTKYERDNEEKFDGKQGLRDQGGHKDKGHEKFRTGHIDGMDQGVEKKKHTGFKFDDRLSNKKGHPGANEIDEAEHQKPDFPKAGGSKKASKGGQAWEDGDEGVDEIDQKSNQKPDFPKERAARGDKGAFGRIKKKPQRMGGMYGGGGPETQ
jgi:hypothetical protein